MKWSPEEEADIKTLSWPQFKAKWSEGRSFNAWRHKRREFQANNELPPKPQLTQTNAQEADIDKLMATWIAFEEEQRKLHHVPSEIEVTLKTDMPIGISFMADTHNGGNGVDMRQIINHTKLIKETPGLYVMLGGDVVNNFVLPKLAHAGQGDASPSVQWQMFRWMLSTLSEKIVAAGSGNHDRWTQRLAGIDQYLATLQQVPTLYVGPGGYLDEGGLLKLRLRAPGLDDVVYRIYRKHKGSGGKTNPLAGPMGLFRFPEHEQLDVAVTEHIHTPAFGSWRHAGREVIGIQVGSYKVADHYARTEGFYNHDVAVPTVIFWPGERKMRLERNLEDAAEYLQNWWQ
jgi:hypothetical protein